MVKQMCYMISRNFKLLALLVISFLHHVANCLAQAPAATLFSLRSPAETGISFKNTIYESDSLNINSAITSSV